MANPTTNYGWQMPTSSDLVTDLPADFEVFGQAVDTALADLKGGTTGQVLAKNSNTDMDFVWVAQDDSNAIQNAIVDAKGDLIAASAADTPARLAVGNNGETLVADSSTSTGLRWTGTPSASNPLINSAFDVWQRGTSFAVPTNYTTYTADRYVAYRGGLNSGATISRQATNDTTNLPFIRYCLRYQRDSGNALTGDLALLSGMETSDSIRYAGRTITFSFYARAGANYSPTSNLLNVRVDSGTGTDQAINTGYTGQVSVISSTATLTTTWQRFTFTGTVAATATELGFYTFASPTGTAGANDWYEVTGFQIDLGSVALPYRRNAGTIQGELAACQRYCQKLGVSGVGMWYSTTNCQITWALPVQMRVAPSITLTTTTPIVSDAGVANRTGSGSTIGLDTTTTTGVKANITGFSGATNGRVAQVQSDGIVLLEGEL